MQKTAYTFQYDADGGTYSYESAQVMEHVVFDLKENVFIVYDTDGNETHRMDRDQAFRFSEMVNRILEVVGCSPSPK